MRRSCGPQTSAQTARESFGLIKTTLTQQKQWTSIHNQYKTIDILGQGTYGVVYKAIDLHTQQLVALKRCRLDVFQEFGIPETTLREVVLLTDLKHDNIMKLHHISCNNDRLYLICEYLELDLKKYIRSHSRGIPLLKIKEITFEILKGLAFCHGHRVIHRDLKPHNILVSSDLSTVKIADFGLARSALVAGKTLTHEVITLWYRAPELLLGHCNYAGGVDIWSAGCITAELLTMKPLFGGDSELDTLFRIFRFYGTPEEEDWPQHAVVPWTAFPRFPPKADPFGSLSAELDAHGKDFLLKTLAFNPKDRWSALKLLQHPWLREVRETQSTEDADFLTAECDDWDQDYFSIEPSSPFRSRTRRYADRTISFASPAYDSDKESRVSSARHYWDDGVQRENLAPAGLDPADIKAADQEAGRGLDEVQDFVPSMFDQSKSLRASARLSKQALDFLSKASVLELNRSPAKETRASTLQPEAGAKKKPAVMWRASAASQSTATGLFAKRSLPITRNESNKPLSKPTGAKNARRGSVDIKVQTQQCQLPRSGVPEPPAAHPRRHSADADTQSKPSVDAALPRQGGDWEILERLKRSSLGTLIERRRRKDPVPQQPATKTTPDAEMLANVLAPPAHPPEQVGTRLSRQRENSIERASRRQNISRPAQARESHGTDLLRDEAVLYTAKSVGADLHFKDGGDLDFVDKLRQPLDPPHASVFVERQQERLIPREKTLLTGGSTAGCTVDGGKKGAGGGSIDVVKKEDVRLNDGRRTSIGNAENRAGRRGATAVSRMDAVAARDAVNKKETFIRTTIPQISEYGGALLGRRPFHRRSVPPADQETLYEDSGAPGQSFRTSVIDPLEVLTMMNTSHDHRVTGVAGRPLWDGIQPAAGGSSSEASLLSVSGQRDISQGHRRKVVFQTAAHQGQALGSLASSYGWRRSASYGGTRVKESFSGSSFSRSIDIQMMASDDIMNAPGYNPYECPSTQRLVPTMPDIPKTFMIFGDTNGSRRRSSSLGEERSRSSRGTPSSQLVNRPLRSAYQLDAFSTLPSYFVRNPTCGVHQQNWTPYEDM